MPELVILLVVIVLLAIRLRATCTIPRKWRSAASVCGHCGYAYSGQPRCPECGGRITHVGLITPRLLLTTGPGPATALGCIVLLGLLIGMIGEQIGGEIQAAIFPSVGRSASNSTHALETRSETFTFIDMRRDMRLRETLSAVANGPSVTPPPPAIAKFEVTVLEQFVRDQSGIPPWPSSSGEILLVLHPPGVNIGSASVGPQLLPDIAPGFPHIRIDPLSRRTRVFEAAGKATAEYGHIAPEAFDELVKLASLTNGDDFDDLTIKAAARLYAAIAAKPDSGGGVSWSLSLNAFFQDTVHIASMGGGSSSGPAPPSLLPPRPLIVFVWPFVWWAGVLLAGILLFRMVLRWRQVLMADPADGSAAA